MKRGRLVVMAAAGAVLLVLVTRLWQVRAVSGRVSDEAGRPIAGALVRVRATALAARTGADGRFVLSGFTPAFAVRVTGWSDGAYISGATAWPWDTEIALVLTPYAVADHPDYAWIPPAVEARSPWETLNIAARLGPAARLAPDTLFFPAAEGLALGCRDCHGEVIYAQWAGSAHALGFANRRFASLYNGTDLSGERRSPPTRYAYNRDYGRFPLPPDPGQPYYGPGYRLDFPANAGNCAACHLPAAALAAPYGTDPNTVTGVDAAGSHCDFCHKIAAVTLDPGSGLPDANRPGVLALEMMRPAPEKQIFFGPYDDVDAGTDTYLPLQRQSAFCAPCHNAGFWGVPIYQSFAEWQASPYSDPAAGKTCQDCHMRPDGVTTNFAPGRAGQERAPEEIFTHGFPGASDQALLQSAVTLTATAWLEGGALRVQVLIANDRTGHHVPTDSPLRQLILLVDATDGSGRRLLHLAGPTVPEWGGRGDPAAGYYAGLPGQGYARVLEEFWTEVSPTAAYWNPTRVLSDNRLAAFATDATTYTFAAPEQAPATVRVTLLFRRAYKTLMDQKGWDVPDVVMARLTLAVP